MQLGHAALPWQQNGVPMRQLNPIKLHEDDKEENDE